MKTWRLFTYVLIIKVIALSYTLGQQHPPQRHYFTPLAKESQNFKANLWSQDLSTSTQEDLIEHIYVNHAYEIHVLYTTPVSASENPYFILEETGDTLTILNQKNAIEYTLQTSIPLEEGINYTLISPSRPTFKGNYNPSIKKAFIWDQTPPEVVQIFHLEKKDFLIVFSESIDQAFALNPANFLLGDNHPIEVKLTDQDHQLIVSFELKELNDKFTNLTVKNICDLHSNYLIEQQYDINLTRVETVNFKSIVINEVMAAPKSGNTLPNVEYIELYNPGDTPIALGGFSIANSRRTTVIPNYTLLPKTYVILTLHTRTSFLEDYGEVLGLTNWPTLLNAGDQIKLFNAENVMVDSLNYTTANYGGTYFANGGFSLEIINPYYPCTEALNLRASQDPNRGTPGAINSVYNKTQEQKSIEITSWSFPNESSLLISFSSSVVDSGLHSQWSISPDLGIKSVHLQPNLKQVLITLTKPFETGVRYSLKLAPIKDCGGSGLSPSQNEISFIVPIAPKEGEVLINEVLFNARIGTPKFVELVNTTNKYLNLRDWKLANLNSVGEIANRRTLFTEDYQVAPNSYLVFTTDVDILKREYPKGDERNFIELISLPSYPISSGSVVLLNHDESIIEIFSYHENMHHPLIKDPRGVSLERYSSTLPAIHPDNWQSASSYIGFASPGIKNSNHFEPSSNLGIEITPKIFAPNHPSGPNFTTIQVNFNQSGYTGSINVYDTQGQLIREICKNDIWGTEAIYTWNGTNSRGAALRPGYYILQIQYFDLKGNVSQIMKTVVVADGYF